MRRLGLVFLLYGCGSAAAPCETTPVVVATSAPALSTEHEPGERVWIKFGESWYPGRIVGVLQPDVYEVGYEGFDSDWNRVARPSQLRPYDRPPPSSALASTPPNALPEAGHPVNDVTQLAQGTHVLVLWNETWWPGVVLGVQGDQALIRYDGYDSATDELVGADRLTIPRD